MEISVFFFSLNKKSVNNATVIFFSNITGKSSLSNKWDFYEFSAAQVRIFRNTGQLYGPVRFSHLFGDMYVRFWEQPCWQQSPVHPALGTQVIPIKVACVVYWGWGRASQTWRSLKKLGSLRPESAQNKSEIHCVTFMARCFNFYSLLVCMFYKINFHMQYSYSL